MIPFLGFQIPHLITSWSSLPQKGFWEIGLVIKRGGHKLAPPLLMAEEGHPGERPVSSNAPLTTINLEGTSLLIH